MQYEKQETIAYQLHLIKTDKFKANRIKINFKRKLEKEEITSRNMLSEVLMQATKNYPTSRLLEIKTEELYNMGYGGSTFSSGNYHVISFGGTFLDEKYTEETMNEQSLEFLLDFIFNPNIENHRFKEETFKLAKNNIRDEIESFQDNPARYAKARLLEEVEPNSSLSYRMVGYLEDLEKITPETLYQYYETILKSDLIDIFVIGNFDTKQMKKIIAEKFNIKTLKKSGTTHFMEHQKYRSRAKTIKETKNIKQSKLMLAYKVEKLTPFEKQYVAPVYSYILGGGPDSFLFQNVREKNSLCYSISASFAAISNLLYISAGIDKKDYNKALRITKEQVRKINRGDFKEEELKKAETTFLSSLKEIEDSASAILNMYISHVYLGYDLLDEREKNIKKVSKNDLLKFSKKIHEDTVFLLEGGKPDEENTTI